MRSSSLPHRKAFLNTLKRPSTRYVVYDEFDDESDVTAAYRVLLERLAKYLYSTPPILHRRVSLIEKQLSVAKWNESFRIPLPEDVSNAEQVHMRFDNLPPTKNLSAIYKERATASEAKSVLQTASTKAESKAAKRPVVTIEVDEREGVTQLTPERVPKSVKKKAKIEESLSRSSCLDAETIDAEGGSIEGQSGMEVELMQEDTALEETIETRETRETREKKNKKNKKDKKERKSKKDKKDKKEMEEEE